MTEHLKTIADYLRRGCIEVTVEYPGCVVVWAEDLVDHPDRCWWFGTANATWMGDLNDGRGNYLGKTLDTHVSSEEADPLIIARAIERVLAGEPPPPALLRQAMPIASVADAVSASGGTRRAPRTEAEWDQFNATGDLPATELALAACQTLIRTDNLQRAIDLARSALAADRKTAASQVSHTFVDYLLDVVGRARSVIRESDGADEHTELLDDLDNLLHVMKGVR